MALEKFHHKIGDVEIVLPNFGSMNSGLIRKTRRLSPTDQMYTMLEMLLGDDSPEILALDTLDSKGLEAFVESWQSHAKISLGESRAS